ncbi:MAG: tripartite tricarboxylate transporter substrate binding protein, partial [Ottowia sp.]|nr:tripartite tricarboxylate transporter substrate binding protein [Ottowia sp.]
MILIAVCARWARAAALFLMIFGWAGAAWPQGADGYPSHPIRIVVPFTPGGSTDVLARAIGQELTRAWGQAVVIDNLPGAGGSIGADKV